MPPASCQFLDFPALARATGEEQLSVLRQPSWPPRHRVGKPAGLEGREEEKRADSARLTALAQECLQLIAGMFDVTLEQGGGSARIPFLAQGDQLGVL